MNLTSRQKTLEEIRLLCRCGVGLAAISSPLCDAVRRLTHADAVALFWFDGISSISGFCHDYAPDEIKELFITRQNELFAPPSGNRIYDVLLTEQTIGTVLIPPPEYFESPLFTLCIRPSGHYWPLDCRIDVDGVPRAAIFLYNVFEKPFDEAHIDLLRPVQALLQRALVSRSIDARWIAEPGSGGNLICDITGRRLLAISTSAQSLFSRSQMMLVDKTLVGASERAPAFVGQLAHLLKSSNEAHIHFGVIGGRLSATARRLAMVQTDTTQNDVIVVDVAFERSVEVLAVEYLSRRKLSPLQREIALFAMLGGTRHDATDEFGIGPEALKKHLKCIYRRTNVDSWAALAALPSDPADPFLAR